MKLNSITQLNPVTGEIHDRPDEVQIFPAKHYITDDERLKQSILDIEEEMEMQITKFKQEEKYLEAQRIEQRTKYDLEMLREVGYCSGVENYSRLLDQRPAGSPPWTLIHYLPTNFSIVPG